MEAIGELELQREPSKHNSSSNWRFEYKAIGNASMYWPNEKRLRDILDEPKCGFNGDKCKKDSTDSSGLLLQALTSSASRLR